MAALIRQVTDSVSQWADGRYFYFFCGDELLMEATNDEDAKIEGAKLEQELNAE